MSPTIEQSVLLNPSNNLTAHRVSPALAPTIGQASLKLTSSLFPHEPTASVGLMRAYEVLTAGSRQYDDCELLDYFVYTIEKQKQQRVVGNAGLYRLTSLSDESQAAMDALRNKPPSNVSFLRGCSYQISDFVWGGRLSIEQATSHSPTCMPFILHHLLLTARNLIQFHSWAPALLAFTRRENNDPVRTFYLNLGFAKTEVELIFAGEHQDVFALALDTDAAVLKRLATLKERAIRRARE